MAFQADQRKKRQAEDKLCEQMKEQLANFKHAAARMKSSVRREISNGVQRIANSVPKDVGEHKQLASVSLHLLHSSARQVLRRETNPTFLFV